MTINDIKKRLSILETKCSAPKIFFNIKHEKDEEIAQYRQEHPYEEVVVFNIQEATTKPDLSLHSQNCD